MRHEDAALALWLASDPVSQPDLACRDLLTAAPEPRSVRQRAGRAVIALGERLAGEPRPVARRRRIATPVS